MLFIRSINPSYRAPIPLPPTPHAGAQPLAGLMTWRAQKKKKKKRKSAYRRVYGGGALRTFLHPASLLILNFYPRTRQETCGGLVYAGRKRTRSLSTSLFCPPNGLAFSQPIYLPTLPTYSLSCPLSLQSHATNPFPNRSPSSARRSTAGQTHSVWDPTERDVSPGSQLKNAPSAPTRTR